MTTHSTIYVDNDSVLLVEGLRDRSGALVSGADVVLEEFTDRHGEAVSGISTPAALTATGSGNYEIAIDDTWDIEANKVYKATVSATYLGYRGEWTETMIAKVRAA